MIGMSSSSRSFEALGTYLVAGRSGLDRDRVAWSTSRNLPTADPELGAKIMRATAAQNVRVDKPVYHLVLSFDPKDAIDRATMERVADRVLAALRLQDQQVVIVAHKDREHAHVHLLVNRVHPETGKVWSRWQDQRIVQQVLREEERALGLRQVPGKLTREADQQELLPGTMEAGPRSGETLPSEQAARARSSYETANELAANLREYERVAELTRLQYAARLDADAARARVAHLSSALDSTQAADKAFTTALGEVYLRPELARQAYAAVVRERGGEAALRMLSDTPEDFGVLRTVERRGALGFTHASDDQPPRGAAIHAADLAAEALAAERALETIAAEARARRLEEMAKLGMETGGGTVAIVDGVKEWVGTAGMRKAASERAEGERHAAHATERDRMLARELRGAPGLPELRDQIARAAGRLLPHELRRLRSMVSAPQWALLAALRTTVRDALLARETERSA